MQQKNTEPIFDGGFAYDPPSMYLKLNDKQEARLRLITTAHLVRTVFKRDDAPDQEQTRSVYLVLNRTEPENPVVQIHENSYTFYQTIKSLRDSQSDPVAVLNVDILVRREGEKTATKYHVRPLKAVPYTEQEKRLVNEWLAENDLDAIMNGGRVVKVLEPYKLFPTFANASANEASDVFADD